jgi:DNA (cytosine-5)-methyltransferase 1
MAVVNELALFTGAGGGILGTHLLGWRQIGYVEWDAYCQRVLVARIADGLIPCAPIFGDVREFVQSGAAKQYRGFAEVVTAGFPCQPFSGAGYHGGANDDRNMWPATLDCIRAVRPRFVFLENVARLIACGYHAVVIAGLAEMGLVGRWGCIPAAGVGAAHVRERVWIVAHAEGDLGQEWNRRKPGFQTWPLCGANGAPGGLDTRDSWMALAGEFVRMDDGLADKLERTTAIGNGQVPRVVAAAWHLLSR